MKKLTIIFLGFFLLFSSSVLARPGVDHLHNVLVFQVGDTRLLFDRSVIQSASATKDTTGKYALNITLNAPEATELTKLTQSNIGKEYTFILNKKIIGPSVIQAAMTASFTVPGFTKEEAENFVHHVQEK